jgi:16S rRNA (guanine527-N7)-methyltransferase
MDASMDLLRPALEAAARTLDVHLAEGQVDSLLAYLALLRRWNSVYNLTAVRDPSAMLTQHLADCLAIIPSLKRHLAGHPARLLDVGSGGGLPGVIVAVSLPDVDVTCVDTVGKKAAFVQQVAAELRQPNLHSAHSRVEQLKRAPFDLITSRAFASLNDFTRLTESLLASGGSWLAMKGKAPADEIAVLTSTVQVFHVEQLAVPDLGAERCLVWMKRAPYNS